MALVNCPKCNTEYENCGKHKYIKKFCSLKCARSRIQTDEDKKKKSIAAKNSEKVKKAYENNFNIIERQHTCSLKNNITVNCPKCGSEFKKYSKWGDERKFCSRKCANGRVFTDETIKKKSISAKNSEKVKEANKKLRLKGKPKIHKNCLNCGVEFIIPYWKRKQQYCSSKCGYKLSKLGGYRENSVRSKHGHYRGIYIASTYELVWVIYRLDHNLSVKRFEGSIIYNDENNASHRYFPDFIDDNTVIEIKGFLTDKTRETMKQKQNSVETLGYKFIMLFKDDLQKEFEWVLNNYTYGKVEELYDNYTPTFKNCNFCGKEFVPRSKGNSCCSEKCAYAQKHKQHK